MISRINLQNTSIQDFILQQLKQLDLGPKLSGFLAILISIIALIFMIQLGHFIIRKLILSLILPWLKRFKNPDIDIFIKKKVFSAITYILLGIFIYYAIPIFFHINERLLKIGRIVAILYIMAMILLSITRILHSLEYLARHDSRWEKKPVNSYVQIILLLIYLISAVLVISLLLGQSPLTIFTAFGAGMAIIILVFQNVILGLVASIQVSANDLIRVGDWVALPKHGADGNVIEINLTSVKIRNWDHTVSNVPTSALITEGFKNVREMEDQRIRRLMHHLLIDLRSIRQVDEKFIEDLQGKNLFSGKLEDLKWTGAEDYQFDKVSVITNLMLFRKYTENLLEQHPGISNSYMVVRQLQQTGDGLPLEIYAFVNSVSFKPLNYIQSDIFEHLYTVLPQFGLIAFQRPSGEDLKSIGAR